MSINTKNEVGRVYRRIAETYMSSIEETLSPLEKRVKVSDFRDDEYGRLEGKMQLERTIREVLGSFFDHCFAQSVHFVDPNEVVEAILHHSTQSMIFSVDFPQLVEKMRDGLIILSMLETLHDNLVKQAKLQNFLKNPTQQHLWLPFFLTGERHMKTCLKIVMPILDSLGIVVPQAVIQQAYIGGVRNYCAKVCSSSRLELANKIASGAFYNAWSNGLCAYFDASLFERLGIKRMQVMVSEQGEWLEIRPTQFISRLISQACEEMPLLREALNYSE